MIRITRSQRTFDDVTFRLPFQTLFFAAFDFAFEIFAISVTVQTGNITIAVAIRLGILDFTSFAEREFFTTFAIARRFRRRRRRSGVLRSGRFRGRAKYSDLHFRILHRRRTLLHRRRAARRRTARSALGLTGILTTGRRLTGAGRLSREDETARAFFATAFDFTFARFTLQRPFVGENHRGR